MNGRKHLCIALFLGIIVAACTPVSKKALRAYAETKEDVSVVADTPTAQQDEPSGRDGDDTQADGEGGGGYALRACPTSPGGTVFQRKG